MDGYHLMNHIFSLGPEQKVWPFYQNCRLFSPSSWGQKFESQVDYPPRNDHISHLHEKENHRLKNCLQKGICLFPSWEKPVGEKPTNSYTVYLTRNFWILQFRSFHFRQIADAESGVPEWGCSLTGFPQIWRITYIDQRITYSNRRI